MTRNEFLSALSEKLYGVPEKDKTASLDYYGEMINDRMEDGMTEEEAVAALGTAEEIAEQILRELSLPIFQNALSGGLDRNRAGVLTLLHLIAHVEDTNLYHRGGQSGAAFAKEYAKRLLSQETLPSEEEVLAMDREFIMRNLSPGGCADLLALTYFVDSLSMVRV